MSLLFWLLIFVIGVFDAREYRIPNYLLLMLFFTQLIIFDFSNRDINLIFYNSYSFFITFIIGLLFYLFKIMAAGDVKLLAVIGFSIGYDGLINYSQYVAISCIFIGGMYWLLNKSQVLDTRIPVAKSSYEQLINHFSIETYYVFNDFKQRKNITYMPLAPVLIVALAMQQYFH